MGQKVKPSPHLGIFADMYHFKPVPKGILKIDVCTRSIGGCGRTAILYFNQSATGYPTRNFTSNLLKSYHPWN